MGSTNRAPAVNYRTHMMKSDAERVQSLRIAVPTYEPPTLAAIARTAAHEVGTGVLWFCGLASMVATLVALCITVQGTRWPHLVAGMGGIVFFGAAAAVAAYMLMVKSKADAPKLAAVTRSEDEGAIAAD